MEYENTDRSGFHKYGRRIRGSESLSLPGSLITTHTTLHNRKIMGIIHLKHTGIKTTKQVSTVSPIWCDKNNLACGNGNV